MNTCAISGTRRFESSISEYRPHLLMKKAKNIVGKKYLFRIFEVPLKLEVRQFEPSRTWNKPKEAFGQRLLQPW